VDVATAAQPAPVRQLLDRAFTPVAWIEEWVRRRFAFAFIIFVGLVVLNELSLFGADVAHWDWLYVTGSLTFVVGWRVALGLPQLARDTVGRLAGRQVLTGDADRLHAYLARTTEAWSRALGVATAVAVGLAFAAALGPAFGGQAWFAFTAAVAGLFVGRRFGASVAIGRLGSAIERGKWEIRTQPGHIDGAAGLKPIGDLYFRQAVILAIPAAFLAIWWLAIPITGRYARWRDPYLGLLAVAIAVELAAFIMPMVSFHRVMRRQKRELVARADSDSRRLHELEERLPHIVEDDERDSIADRVKRMQDYYRVVEDMPTWPVDPPTRRRLSVNNLLLLLPLVAKTVGLALPGGDLLRGLAEIFGSG
jgi:hypothetical protein